MVRRGGQLRLAGGLPGDLRPHRRGHADRGRAPPGRRRVRRGPGRRRRRLRRGPLRPRAARDRRPGPRGGRAGRQRGLPRGRAPRGRRRPPHPGRRAADRDAARRPLDGDRRARDPLPRRRGRRLRHRRRRGGLPAHPPPGRLRVPPAGERALHDPRRRGLRAAVDLAGHPVVRRRPARPRRADHRRHRGRRRRRHRPREVRSGAWRRTSGTSASRWRCARPPT